MISIGNDTVPPMWAATLRLALAAPLLVLTTADAVLRIWRSAWAWMPVDRGRGLFRLAWVAVSNIVAGFIFAWAYLKVARSFSPGVSGGAMMGLFAGVLINCPSAIVLNLVIQDFP